MSLWLWSSLIGWTGGPSHNGRGLLNVGLCVHPALKVRVATQFSLPSTDTHNLQRWISNKWVPKPSYTVSNALNTYLDPICVVQSINVRSHV